MKEKVRGYVLIPEDTVEVINPACLLIRYFPTFLWNIWYLKSEGIEDIRVVGENAQVQNITKLFGIPFLSNAEYKAEKLDGIDYVVKLSATIPFHQPGLIEVMIRQASEARRVITSKLEIELIRLHTFNTSSKVLDLPAPYNLSMTDMKAYMSGAYIPTIQKEQRNLLPHPFKKIALVQNVDRYERNYSDFIDSCDLVMRCNLLDNYISGLYGKRCDIALLGIWYTYKQFIPYFKDMREIYHAIPLTYGKSMESIEPEKFPYTFPLLDSISSEHWWTTTLIGIHMLLYAFPDAKIYTTSIRTRIDSEATAHKYMGDEERVWEYLLATGRVTDIMAEGEKEKYSTDQLPIHIKKVRCGKAEVIVNEESKRCKWKGRQEFGKLLYMTPDKIGISWLVSGKTWEGKKKGDSYEEAEENTGSSNG